MNPPPIGTTVVAKPSLWSTRAIFGFFPVTGKVVRHYAHCGLPNAFKVNFGKGIEVTFLEPQEAYTF